MPRLKDVQPAGDVWVVNPHGVVVAVKENSAAADKARAREGGWFWATEDQVADAKRAAGERGRRFVAAQEQAQELRIRMGAKVTPIVRVDDSDLGGVVPVSAHPAIADDEPPRRRGPGRPRKNPEPETE